MRISRVVLVGVAAGWLTTTPAPSAGMGEVGSMPDLRVTLVLTPLRTPHGP